MPSLTSTEAQPPSCLVRIVNILNGYGYDSDIHMHMHTQLLVDTCARFFLHIIPYQAMHAMPCESICVCMHVQVLSIEVHIYIHIHKENMEKMYLFTHKCTYNIPLSFRFSSHIHTYTTYIVDFHAHTFTLCVPCTLCGIYIYLKKYILYIL